MIILLVMIFQALSIANCKLIQFKSPRHPVTVPPGVVVTITTTSPPATSIKCGQEGQVFPLYGQGDQCPKFYICTRDNCTSSMELCLSLKECREGFNFNEETKKCCKSDKCPVKSGESGQFVDSKPVKCTGSGQLHPRPANCREYYECVPCPDNQGNCYIPKSCETNYFFNETVGTCVPGAQCKNKTGIEVECQAVGERHILPGKEAQCNIYYECQTCPEGGWCLVSKKCPPKQYFDEIFQTCLRSVACRNRAKI